MRNTSVILFVLVLAAYAVYVYDLRERGGRLRVAERQAAERVTEILEEMERLRLEVPPEREAFPYPRFSRILEEGRLEGFELLDVDVRETFVNGDYLFHVRIHSPRGWMALREDDETGPSQTGFGDRFEVWAWPRDPAQTAMVLFYGSNAGYVIQGENGKRAGPGATLPPPDDNPVKKLVERSRELSDPETGAWRTVADDEWLILASIRSPGD